MLGLTLLKKELFTTYTYTPTPSQDLHERPEDPLFQISLSSLLETLQIFGVNDARDRWSSRDPNYGGISGSIAKGGPAGVFDNRVLGMAGVCRLSYAGAGAPFCVTLEETGVTTTCELVTYDPEEMPDIPLQKDSRLQRIIMRASALHDAIAELSSTSPSRITMVASPAAPFFSLTTSGTVGSATVEFSKDPELVETFHVPERTVNTYSYALIRNASRAMSMAKKVSIRSDEHGVLSLQFMIDVEGTSVTSYVDFRFVAFLSEDGEDDDGGEENEVEEDTE